MLVRSEYNLVVQLAAFLLIPLFGTFVLVFVLVFILFFKFFIAFGSMNGFASSLVVRTLTSHDHKLPRTASLFYMSNLFAISTDQSVIYTINNGWLEMYGTSPMVLIGKIPYKSDVLSLISLPNYLVILNINHIILFNGKIINKIDDDFKDCNLIGIKSNNWYYGVQSKHNLRIYDDTGNKLDVLDCQSSYATDNILLIGNMNELILFINESRVATILLPGRIRTLICDQLFTSIFCSQPNGDIHLISTSGKSERILKYHENEVKSMKLSICGELLYSHDGRLLCVWDIAKGVVIGQTDHENEILQLELFMSGERAKPTQPIL